jgi:hypothetical protein
MILAVSAIEGLVAAAAFITGLTSLIAAFQSLILAAAKATHDIHEEFEEHHHDHADAERDPEHR